MKVKWVNPWYRQFSENTQVSFKSLFQLTLRLKITISYDPDVVCMDSSSGFTHVLSFTKKTWTHTCLLTFSRGKLGTMLLKRSEMQFFVVFFFIKTAVLERYTVLGIVLSKQLTCYWGSYKRYFSEAPILRPMVHNGVTCRMISPYKVKWHSRLKHGKRTMKKVVTRLQSRSCCWLSSDKSGSSFYTECNEVMFVQ